MRRVKMCDVFMNAQCSNNEKIMTCGTPLCHPSGVHVNFYSCSRGSAPSGASPPGYPIPPARARVLILGGHLPAGFLLFLGPYRSTSAATAEQVLGKGAGDLGKVLQSENGRCSRKRERSEPSPELRRSGIN